MKGTHFCIFLLALPFLLHGQKTRSLDFVSGIDITYRYLTSKSRSPISSFIIQTRNQRELPNLNWRIGVNYNQKLTGNYFLKSGIRLAKLGYSINVPNEDLRWPSQLNNPNSPGEDVGDIKFYYNYLFVEVPVHLRYEIDKKRFTPFLEAGFSPMYLLQYASTTITDSKTNVSFGQPVTTNFFTFQVAAVLSFGFNYQPNETMQIFGQPTLRYHFTKLADAPISEFLYSCGIEFGVRRLW